MIGKKILHYKVVEKLGAGGMGVVYMAEDSRLKRDVAIKFLPHEIASSPDGRQRFMIEAQAAAAINHPGVAQIYAIEEVDDEIFIAMEYVKGSELRELVGSDQLSLERIVDVAMQIASALRAAHGKGIVHRDIKSANIMVTPDFQVKVMDFGLAKVRDGARLTRVGTTVGTVAYMSPEQARGEDVDRRTDIWSFGVVLYEMITGERPFKGHHEQAVLYSIVNEEPRPLSAYSRAVPPATEAIIRKALDKDREERYASMDELIEDLSALQDDISGSTSKERKAGTDRGEIPGLAVLPFASVRVDPEMDFLGFGLADQIIGVLAYIEGIVVRPSSAIRKYQQQAIDAPTAAKELAVEFVLSGSYLKEADTVRLNLELVNAQSNEMVWREAIQVKYENAFKLQDIVSEKVLQRMKVQFSPAERDLMQAHAPEDPLAYEYFLRAVSCPLTLDGSLLAIQMLNKSIEIDPNYAPVYSELGYRLSQEASYAMTGIEGRRQAEAALHKALSLNENLLTALWQLSLYYTEIGKSGEALELIRRMLRVTPNSAIAHFALSYVYRYVGMAEESQREVETALSVDPRNPRFRSGGFSYLYAGNYARAYEVFDLDGDSAFGYAGKGLALAMLGERERAVENLDRAIALEPKSFTGLLQLAVRAFVRGEREKCLQALRDVEAAKSLDTDAEHWYFIASLYGALGDKINCARVFKRAVEGGFFNYAYMLRDPFLDPVRNDPEIMALIAAAREKHDAFRARYFPERESATEH